MSWSIEIVVGTALVWLLVLGGAVVIAECGSL